MSAPAGSCHRHFAQAAQAVDTAFALSTLMVKLVLLQPEAFVQAHADAR